MCLCICTVAAPTHPFPPALQSKQALEIEAAATKRIAELKLELAAVRKESERMATLTVDEVLAADPKLAAELDKEIKEDKWY